MKTRPCPLVWVPVCWILGAALSCDDANSRTVVATTECSCVGKQCGNNSCGTSCGTCAADLACSAEGQCICPEGKSCDCLPSCGAKQCGPDGCGGVCGTCPDGQDCSADGQCGCAAVDAETLGGYLRIEVSWDGNIGMNKGSGVIHLWTRDDLTYSGATFTAQTVICGSDIPEIVFSALGGPGKLKFDFPEAIFELGNPPMPVLGHGGSSAGFEVGAAFSVSQSASMLGCSMADPSAAWPGKSALTEQDDDGDGKPGLTAVNRKDDTNGYVYPPLDIAKSKRADKTYLASRVIFALSGTRDSCTSATGVATVTSFDYHVVGCHVSGEEDCTESQSSFIDGLRPTMKPGNATWKVLRVAPGTTCAKIRETLPLVP